ncbi:hypothetical protein [Pseudomonas sp. BF-R-21]|uniref:hypothetical protein n=1 Tax=Pseudomonas sp. BF-R-21 TaxID=2832387 RepID=UPI001CBCCCDA|nr:hypothetical protein [Pseudomonas sp. BF-R-21]
MPATPVPPPYTRQTSFTDWEANHPGEPATGTSLDAEFNAVQVSMTDTQARLALIQRDDGALANYSVGRDQLDPELAAALAGGFYPRGAWQANTKYKVSDAVNQDGVLWAAVVDHTSGASFAVDVSAGKWMFVSQFVAAPAIPITPIPPMSATTVQGALETLNTFDVDLGNQVDPAKGAGKLGFLGGTIYAALMANRCLPVEVLATKYGLPLSNIGAIVNAAWAAGIGVALSAPQYTTSTAMLVRTGAVLVGQGSGLTTIKSVNGFTGNVIDTLNFAALQAAQTVSVNDPVNPVPKRFVLCGFAVDGNVLNYAGTVSDTNGFGIRLYGAGYSVVDIKLTRIPGVGFYSELAPFGTYYNSDPLEFKAFSPTDEYGGVGIRGLYIFDTGEEGFVFVGPADINVRDVFVGWPAGSYRNDYTPGKTSKLFAGRSVDTAVILRSCEIGFIHAFDNRFGYGIYTDRQGVGKPAVRFGAESVMSENCFGNYYFGSQVRYQIGVMESHNNTGGDGTRPHIDMASALGGTAPNVKIKKEAGYLSEYASDCVRLTGVKHKMKIFIDTTTGQTAGRGVLCSSPLSDIEVHASAMAGVPQSGGSLSYVAEVTSTFTGSKLKVVAQLCDGGINFSSSPSGDYGSDFELVSDRCTTPLAGVSALQRRQTGKLSVTHQPVSGVPQRNAQVAITSVNLTSTLLQTLAIGHGLVAAPLIHNCQLYLTPTAGSVMPDLLQLYVTTVDATSATVQVKFGAGGTGTASLCLRASI